MHHFLTAALCKNILRGQTSQLLKVDRRQRIIHRHFKIQAFVNGTFSEPEINQRKPSPIDQIAQCFLGFEVGFGSNYIQTLSKKIRRLGARFSDCDNETSIFISPGAIACIDCYLDS